MSSLVQLVTLTLAADCELSKQRRRDGTTGSEHQSPRRRVVNAGPASVPQLVRSRQGSNCVTVTTMNGTKSTSDLPWKPTIRLPGDTATMNEVMNVIDSILLTDADMTRLMETMDMEMTQGLSGDPEERKKTSLQMAPSYIRSLLDGTEDGDFLALDLGGTNFRVLLCKIRNGKCRSISRKYNVPPETRSGPAAGVFDHVAESIYKFLKEENMLDQKLPLGFSFSFPMEHKGVRQAILTTWTKTFHCPDGVGEDVVEMLESAITKRGDTQVDVVAVLNDATGTLLAGSYVDHTCHIGLIMGTGYNMAYLESLTNVNKWDQDFDEPSQVVIDVEWGAFGDNGSLDFLKTDFDRAIDAHSHHHGSFTFEKLFSGHYVGDLLRLVLVQLTERGLMFQGRGLEKLRVWGCFKANYISDIERDTERSVKMTWRVLETMGLHSLASDDDVAILRYLASAVSVRAAQIVGACLSVVTRRTHMQHSTVAMDGSQYRYHPKLQHMISAWVAHFVPQTKSNLVLVDDGSGRGAGFAAAVEMREAAQHKARQTGNADITVNNHVG